MNGTIVQPKKLPPDVDPYEEAASRGKILLEFIPLNPEIKDRLDDVIAEYFPDWKPDDPSILQDPERCFDALQRHVVHRDADRQLDRQGVPREVREPFHEDVESFCDQMIELYRESEW